MLSTLHENETIEFVCLNARSLQPAKREEEKSVYKNFSVGYVRVSLYKGGEIQVVDALAEVVVESIGMGVRRGSPKQSPRQSPRAASIIGF